MFNGFYQSIIKSIVAEYARYNRENPKPEDKKIITKIINNDVGSKIFATVYKVMIWPIALMFAFVTTLSIIVLIAHRETFIET